MENSKSTQDIFSKRLQVAKELADLEKQIFGYENVCRTSIQNSNIQIGNIVNGYHLEMDDKKEEDTNIDRIFSKSSTTYKEIVNAGESNSKNLSKAYSFEKMEELRSSKLCQGQKSKAAGKPERAAKRITRSVSTSCIKIEPDTEEYSDAIKGSSTILDSDEVDDSETETTKYLDENSNKI